MSVALPAKLRPCGCSKDSCFAFQSPQIYNSFPNAALTITLDSHGRQLNIVTKKKDPMRPWRCPKPLYLLPPSLAGSYYGYNPDHEVCHNRRIVPKRTDNPTEMREKERAYRKPQCSPLRQIVPVEESEANEREVKEPEVQQATGGAPDSSKDDEDPTPLEEQDDQPEPLQSQDQNPDTSSIAMPPEQKQSRHTLNPKNYLQATATISYCLSSRFDSNAESSNLQTSHPRSVTT